MVLLNGLALVPISFCIFLEFSMISGLFINVAKTVLVPLYPVDILGFRSELARMVPEWGGYAVSHGGKIPWSFRWSRKGYQTVGLAYCIIFETISAVGFFKLWT